MLRCLALGGAKPTNDAPSVMNSTAPTPQHTRDEGESSPPASDHQPELTIEAHLDDSIISTGLKASTEFPTNAEATATHSSTALTATNLSPVIEQTPSPSAMEASQEEIDEAGDLTVLDVVPSLDADGTESQPITLAKRNQRKPNEKYSIRLVPCVDHSLALPFHYSSPVERRTTNDTVIRVGRLNSNDPANDAETPIVFKSKVVSRTHAELQCVNGEWFIRDLQSSSGTFLNNVRLSQPNKASPLCKLNNGDVLQLGLNFRGGSEEVFQAVKVRIELNYSWHRQVSEYNVETLRKLKSQVSGAEVKGLQECTICLEDLKPRQPLFLAPCSHGWHYACIRPLLVKFYPHFSCPNCRDIFNLEESTSDSES